MLRDIVLGVGLVGLVGGVFGTLEWGPPSLWFAFWGALLVAGTQFERFRYKRLEAPPREQKWEATEERFVDDETGLPVTVYIDRATGERKYVTDRPPAP